MAIDVGSAVGYLDLDISGFLKNLRSAQEEAKSSASDIASNFESGFSGIGSVLSSAGTKLTAGITAPVVAAGTAMVKSYANAEQAIGGSEAVFEKYADNIKNKSEEAYESMGLSATKYLETANKMGSLFQGSGLSTEKSLDLTTNAMQRAADVASVMGISTESAMESIAGAAKGNFTMMDNLGVAMNATTIEAYALSKGFEDFSYNSATNAEKAEIAMQMFFEKTSKYAGNFQRESLETVSGSVGMFKSAFENLVAGMGDPSAEIDVLLNNVVESFRTAAENIKETLKTIWDNLPISNAAKDLIAFSATVGPVLLVLGNLTTGVGEVFGAFTKISTAVPIVGEAISGIQTHFINLAEGFKLAQAGFPALGAEASKFGAVIGGLSAPILGIVAAVTALIAIFTTLWKTNEDFRNKMTEIWSNIKETVSGFCDGIVERLNSLGFDFENIVDVIKTIWQNFCNLFAPIFEGAFSLIQNALQSGLDVLTGILDVFIGLFTGNWEQCWNGVKEVFSGIWEGLSGVFEIFWNTIKGIADVILGWFGTSWNEAWTSVGDFFKNTWNSIKDFFSSMGESISDAFHKFIDGVVDFFSDLPYNIGKIIGDIIGTIAKFVVDMVAKAKEVGKNFVDNVVNFFKELPGKVKEFVTNTINNVKTWATDMASKSKEAAKNFLDNVTNGIKNLPNNVKTTITNVLNNVKTWATDMASKAREAAKNVFDNIVNGIKNLPSEVLSIGKNIVEGLWNGISGAAGWLYDQVKSFATGVIDGIKSALGINSPSKVAEKEIGLFVPPGIGNGFKKALPKTLKGMKDELNSGMSKIGEDLKPIDITSNFDSGDFDTGWPKVGIRGMLGIDYDILAEKFADVLRRAPIKSEVRVDMKDGDVYFDNERVGRKIAPVVSRVLAQDVPIM